MTDKGCEKALADLEHFLHNELCKEDARDVREHMENCIDCAEEAHVGTVLTEAIKRACSETAPEDLRAAVLKRMREVQASH